MFSEEKRSYKAILVSAVVLVAIAAVGTYLFFKIYDHPSVAVTVSRVAAVPLHMQYAHEKGYGEDRSEDATYLVAQVDAANTTEFPYFLKDITAQITPKGGGEIIEISAIQKDDVPKLIAGLPQIKAATDALSSTPLSSTPLTRETKIEPHSKVSGFVILQYPGTTQIWNERDAATLRLDFYHNNSFTAPFPK